MKNSDDTIGDGTRDLPACSAVPQSTAPLHAPPWNCPMAVLVLLRNTTINYAVSLLLPHEEFKLCTVVDTIICSARPGNCLPRSMLLITQNIKLFFVTVS